MAPYHVGGRTSAPRGGRVEPQIVLNRWFMMSAANAICNFFQGWLVSPVITFQ